MDRKKFIKKSMIAGLTGSIILSIAKANTNQPAQNKSILLMEVAMQLS